MCLAVPGRILDKRADDIATWLARVDFDGVIKEVSLAFVPEAEVGDYVLIHAGFAIAVLGEEDAAATLAEFAALAASELKLGA
jgi:hydrogenase expression/formation protein HypC